MVCKSARLSAAILTMCFIPCLANAEPWDISLKMEIAGWQKPALQQSWQVLPQHTAVISKSVHQNLEPSRFNSNFETFMRHHFKAANPAFLTGVTLETRDSDPALSSPSALSHYVDSETSQRNTTLLGTALDMQSWTLGAGYVWQQHRFISRSQDKTTGFVVGISYNAPKSRTDISYLASRQIDESTKNIDKRQYNSLMASYTWQTNEKWHYTATLQYRDIKKQYRDEKDSYRATVGLKYIF